MENKKINIAELLKDCPRGMELDCTMYEDVYFDYVDELNIIHCYIQYGTHKTSLTFNQHGTPNSDRKSKCVIFPKGKTTWEDFVPPYKFKVGDKIRHKTNNKDDIYEISAVYDDFYGLVDFTFMLDMKYQDQYELVPNKFDIATLKPFKSEVLVRNFDSNYWKPAIFGFTVKDKNAPFFVEGGNKYNQCIPYEGNEHLLGTINDCDDFYKTW